MKYRESIQYFGRMAVISAAIGLFTISVPSRADKQITTTADTAVSGTVEDSDEEWIWTGMQTVSGPEFHKGSARAGAPATSGVYVFTGTGVGVFGIHAVEIKAGGVSHSLGKMTVIIDGKQQTTLDLSKAPSALDNRIFHIDGLSSGNHVLQVKVIEGWGAIDYIVVQNDTPPDDGGKDYRITPKSSPDKWLDTVSDAMVDDASLGIYSFPRVKHSQIWHVVSLGKGEFRISPKEKPDQALTLITRTADIDGVANSRAGLYKYAGDAAQQWEMVPGSPGYYRIVNTFDHRCLNVGGGKNDEGASVIVYQVTNEDNDQWRFVPVSK